MKLKLWVVALATWVGLIAEASVLTDARARFRHPGLRRFGIEIEFVGVPLGHTATLARRILGGELVFDKVAGLDRVTLVGSAIGDLVVKVETNITREGEVTPPEQWVYEIVTPPLYYAQLGKLQEFVAALRELGAKGTRDGHAVSIQINQEILNPKIELPVVLVMTRLYLEPRNFAEIQRELEVAPFRQKYLGGYSPEMMKRLLDPQYFRAPARQVYDDFFYRQTLELETRDPGAWAEDIVIVKEKIRALGYPRNPQVVKLNSIRLSSLLMMIFPDDPFTKAIAADNWAYAKPLVEHRDENNLHDVFSPVERSHGLYLMAEDIVRRELGAAWECEKNLARKKKRAA